MTHDHVTPETDPATFWRDQFLYALSGLTWVRQAHELPSRIEP